MTPILVDVRQAAELLGIGVRTVHKLRADPSFPQPLALGPRATRWHVAELQAWIETRPRVIGRQEPPELERSRAAKRGSAGGPIGGSQPAHAAKPRRARTKAERGSVELRNRTGATA